MGETILRFTKKSRVSESAAAIKELRVAPLGAVVTHKVRIINDYLLMSKRLEERRGD